MCVCKCFGGGGGALVVWVGVGWRGGSVTSERTEMLTVLLCVCWAVFSLGRIEMRELAHSYLLERQERKAGDRGKETY